MKKIAIYGDSFGNHYLKNTFDDDTDRGLAWPEWLEKKYQVTNFAHPGTSLFYSHKLFLENNKDFDYNIFLVTEPNRITIPEESILPELGMNHHINLSLIETYSRYSGANKPLISALNLYYGLIHNTESVNIFHNLIVDNITRINQNTLIIPCFRDSLNNTTNSLHGISTFELREHRVHKKLIENGYYPWCAIEDETGTWTYADYRKCHFSEENNKILSILIDRAIDNNHKTIDLSASRFVKAEDNIEKYFLYVDLTQSYNERRLNGELNNFYKKHFE